MCKDIIVCDVDDHIYHLNRVFWALTFRVDPSKDAIQFPGWISALDPIIHPKSRLGPGGYKGIRLLIEATKAIDRPRAEEYWEDKFAVVAYPDEETMGKVRKS